MLVVVVVEVIVSGSGGGSGSRSGSHYNCQRTDPEGAQVYGSVSYQHERSMKCCRESARWQCTDCGVGLHHGASVAGSSEMLPSCSERYLRRYKQHAFCDRWKCSKRENKTWNQKKSQCLSPCMAQRSHESASYATM